jgi:hypothetical protein
MLERHSARAKARRIKLKLPPFFSLNTQPPLSHPAAMSWSGRYMWMPAADAAAGAASSSGGGDGEGKRVREELG